jgi:hypothetical protein
MACGLGCTDSCIVGEIDGAHVIGAGVEIGHVIRSAIPAAAARGRASPQVADGPRNRRNGPIVSSQLFC